MAGSVSKHFFLFSEALQDAPAVVNDLSLSMCRMNIELSRFLEFVLKGKLHNVINDFPSLERTGVYKALDKSLVLCRVT